MRELWEIVALHARDVVVVKYYHTDYGDHPMYASVANISSVWSVDFPK